MKLKLNFNVCFSLAKLLCDPVYLLLNIIVCETNQISKVFSLNDLQI